MKLLFFMASFLVSSTRETFIKRKSLALGAAIVESVPNGLHIFVQSGTSQHTVNTASNAMPYPVIYHYGPYIY